MAAPAKSTAAVSWLQPGLYRYIPRDHRCSVSVSNEANNMYRWSWSAQWPLVEHRYPIPVFSSRTTPLRLKFLFSRFKLTIVTNKRILRPLLPRFSIVILLMVPHIWHGSGPTCPTDRVCPKSRSISLVLLFLEPHRRNQFHHIKAATIPEAPRARKRLLQNLRLGPQTIPNLHQIAQVLLHKLQETLRRKSRLEAP